MSEKPPRIACNSEDLRFLGNLISDVIHEDLSYIVVLYPREREKLTIEDVAMVSDAKSVDQLATVHKLLLERAERQRVSADDLELPFELASPFSAPKKNDGVLIMTLGNYGQVKIGDLVKIEGFTYTVSEILEDRHFITIVNEGGGAPTGALIGVSPYMHRAITIVKK